MNQILQKLQGGDLRSIGRSDEVVQDILKKPYLFEDVFKGILSEDPIVRMRSADAIEKVSKKHPEYLQPFKNTLIEKISKIEQKEVRWHVAQLFSYININKKEQEKIIKILKRYISQNKSKIVKTFSMQTLANFAEKDESIRSTIIDLIKEIMKTGSPAIISRGKKLLLKLRR